MSFNVSTYVELTNYISLCNIHNTFDRLCINGQLEDAKIYYNENLNKQLSYYDDLIPKYFYDSLFVSVCKYGHLEVCKWLLEIKPNINISAFQHKAFHSACFIHNLEIAKWLQSLKPYLYIIYYNNDDSYNRHYIRLEEEEKWQRRIYATWLASDNSPNKNNIFYIVPKEISRMIITYL